MNVSYDKPLGRAISRARSMLFQPFSLEFWLVLGFAAFLSEGVAFHGGFGSHGHGLGRGFPTHWMHGLPALTMGALFTGLAVIIGIVVLALAVLIAWIHSRGRFIFLDGVARRRAAIVEPWSRLKRLGNSLFFWSIGFFFVCMAAAAAIVLPFLATIVAIFRGGEFQWAMLGALGTMLVIACPFAIVFGYTMLFMSDFVVPIMYRHDLGAIAAWGRFLSLFRAHPGPFLLYGIMVLTLWILITAGLTLVGLLTCCVGLMLFALPYIGNVVLLPVLVSFRAFGPEFLAQFGPEYEIFAPAQTAPSPPPASATASGAPPEPPAPGQGAV